MMKPTVVLFVLVSAVSARRQTVPPPPEEYPDSLEEGGAEEPEIIEGPPAPPPPPPPPPAPANAPVNAIPAGAVPEGVVAAPTVGLGPSPTAIYWPHDYWVAAVDATQQLREKEGAAWELTDILNGAAHVTPEGSNYDFYLYLSHSSSKFICKVNLTGAGRRKYKYLNDYECTELIVSQPPSPYRRRPRNKRYYYGYNF